MTQLDAYASVAALFLIVLLNPVESATEKTPPPCLLCPGGTWPTDSSKTISIQLPDTSMTVEFSCGQLAAVEDLGQTLFVQRCAEFSATYAPLCGCPAILSENKEEEEDAAVSTSCPLCSRPGSLRPDGVVEIPGLGTRTCRELAEMGDLNSMIQGAFQNMNCDDFQTDIVQDVCACRRNCGPLCADGMLPLNPNGTVSTVIGDFTCLQMYALGGLDSGSYGQTCGQFEVIGEDECGCGTSATGSVETSPPTDKEEEQDTTLSYYDLTGGVDSVSRLSFGDNYSRAGFRVHNDRQNNYQVEDGILY